MRAIIIILAVLLLLGLAGAYYWHGIARGAKTVIIMQRLGQAAADLKNHGSFTNDIQEFCEIYQFTEHYKVSGSDYECVLAAKSPIFRGRGLLAITTNNVIIWIDNNGRVIPATGPHSVE
jgi:hypothetical protein